MHNRDIFMWLNNPLKYCRICWIALSIFLLILLFPFRSFPQSSAEYEEISVSLFVQGVGSADIPALISGQEIYLPVYNVFDFLRIKNTVSPGLDTVNGFFINPEASFLIDRSNKKIQYQDKVFNLNPNDLLRTESNLFMKSNYFGDVFGLVCNFNFRGLMVTINTKAELPVIREMRLEQMRKNIGRLKDENKADTTIERSYPFFELGAADYSISSSQQVEQRVSNTRLNLALGGTLAGGEAKAVLNHYSLGQAFDDKQLDYIWRLADNSNPLLRQLIAGKINTQAVSTIYAPVIGAQFTNTPTSFRRSFGSYTLSNYTEPGWIVELYMNNVLVDYIKADDHGFFTFNVPLIYGNTEIELRYYGPWGEERNSRQVIAIPYNFLPTGEFEYTMTNGIVDDNNHSLFSRTSFNYGLSQDVTIGGGVEYLSSLPADRAIPYFKTSLGLAPGLLFSGEYIHGVKSNGILSYHMPSELNLELNYTRYKKGQIAIVTNNIEERKIVMSMPLRFGNYMAFSRFYVNQFVLPRSKFTMADLLLSSSVMGVNTSLITNGMFFNSASPFIFSSLVLSFSLPERFIIRPQLMYDYHRKSIHTFRLELEKQFFGTTSLNAILQNNFITHSASVQVGFRYEFPFAQTGATAYYGEKSTTLAQWVNGSLMYDHNTNYIKTNNRAMMGKCGLIILPYLDLNGNGSYDTGEPKISGLNFHISGGQIERNDKDTTIQIFDLEPYTNYYIEIASTSFDNVSWHIANPTMNVSINPNQFKLIEVPIAVRGEATGMIYFKDAAGKRGLGRVYVCFYDSLSRLIGRVLSEEDGYFSYMGLKPGSYTARIDKRQLNKIQMTSTPEELHFNIRPGLEGDVAEGLEFVLESIQSVSGN